VLLREFGDLRNYLVRENGTRRVIGELKNQYSRFGSDFCSDLRQVRLKFVFFAQGISTAFAPRPRVNEG